MRMTVTTRSLLRPALVGLLLLSPISGFGQEDNLCEPFRYGKVDESLLETMLTAAEEGHLYRIEQETSQMGFCVDSQLARIEGSFKEFQGGMTLHPVTERQDSQAMVVIKTASVDTKSAFIKGIIKGENFFDVEHNPEILFVSKGLRWTSKDTAELVGDLTLRGTTKPVTFHVNLTPVTGGKVGETARVQVKATANISRSEFGMNALESLISDEVQLCMTVQARKYQDVKLEGINGKY